MNNEQITKDTATTNLAADRKGIGWSLSLHYLQILHWKDFHINKKKKKTQNKQQRKTNKQE